MDTQDLQLLNAISAFGDFTAAKLAEKLGISERNVRERLKRLESELHLHGGQIVSKPGKGHSFQITQQNQFSAWLSSMNKDEHSIPTTTHGRVSYILEALLYAEGFLKLDDLCDKLYISRTTMTGDMKQVKKILQQYHLTLLQRAGSGVRIHGNEFNIRNCMVYCELEKENTLEQARWISDDRRKIVDSLSLAFKQNNLTLAKQTFLWLLTYISIATKRLHDNHYVQFTEERRQELDENTGKNIAEAARTIGRDMLAWAGSEDNPDEIAGLIVLIRDKGVFCITPSDDIGIVESQPLEKTAKAMLDAIYEIHGLDYRDDQELLLSLTQHMVSFDVRMRYNLTLANPILDQIKEEYSMAFHIAISACTVLQRIYGNPVPESEIGYFALIFALSNQRRERKPRKNVLVVCTSGHATSRLFMHRYQAAFQAYVNEIYTCSAFQLSSFDIVGLKIDYVFTTVPLDIALPVPVFQVSLLLSDQEIEKYRRVLLGNSSDYIRQYFKEPLFLGKLSAASKEEALISMCHRIGKLLPLPDGFCKSVLLREKMGQTDFGNLIAIPHPCEIMGTEKFVSVAVLDKPVWWGHNDVQVILLISLELDDPTVEYLYEMISGLMDSPNAVKALIRTPTYQTLTDVFDKKDQQLSIFIQLYVGVLQAKTAIAGICRKCSGIFHSGELCNVMILFGCNENCMWKLLRKMREVKAWLQLKTWTL